MCQGHQGKGITGHWPLMSLGHLAPRHRVTGGAGTLGAQVNASKQRCSFRRWRPTPSLVVPVLALAFLSLAKLKNSEPQKHL